jgi:NAD(P)-dependent dehydrogenase (short-subunit alcohol dehydrogenase family)
VSEQKIAFVTGANKGIGYAIATGLGAFGYSIGVGARRVLRDTNVLINAACPGFVATDLNGFRGVRTPEEGATSAIRPTPLPDDGPTGGFFEDAGPIPW